MVAALEIAAALALLLVVRTGRREAAPLPPATELQQVIAPQSGPGTPRGNKGPTAPATEPPPAPTLSPFARVTLDSDPTGATVSAGGQVLGVTPLVWETKSGGEVVELTFARDGYRREVILTVPAPGLALRPRLRRAGFGGRPSPAPRPIAAAGDAAAPAPAVPDDIKTER